ncbi:MAG: hypothetical protein ABIA93_07570 [Candidatus Woesearchaeota archaeon]
MEDHTYESLDAGFKMRFGTQKHPYAAFVLPVLQTSNEPFLAIRNTEPFVGLFSVVGGKVDTGSGTEKGDRLGERARSSRRLEDQGWERPKLTSLREFAEEIYGSTFAETFPETPLNQSRIARINDAVTGVSMYVYLATVPEKAFSPSEREVGEIRALGQINAAEMNPLTQVVMRALHDNPAFERLAHLIPPKEELTVIFAGPKAGTDHYLFTY